MNNTSQQPKEDEKVPTGAMEQNKAMAIIGYIIPILFFVPLLSDAKNDPFAAFHANQQLNILIYWVALNILGVIPIIGWILYPFGVLFGIVLAIMGAVNAANGRQKKLPVIGQYSLLK